MVSPGTSWTPPTKTHTFTSDPSVPANQLQQPELDSELQKLFTSLDQLKITLDVRTRSDDEIVDQHIRIYHLHPEVLALLGAAVDITISDTVTWQKPVLGFNTGTPPASPTTGDRYVVGPNATGVWTNRENDIAEWNGVAWDFASPQDGWATIVEGSTTILIYAEASQAWNALAGLADYTHPNHTGDVVSEGDGATTIQDGVVSLSKLASDAIAYIDASSGYTHPNHTGDVTSAGDGATTIAANAVTAGKIADGAVLTTKIGNFQITPDKILNAAVQTDKLADQAVTSAKVAAIAPYDGGSVSGPLTINFANGEDQFFNVTGNITQIGVTGLVKAGQHMHIEFTMNGNAIDFTVSPGGTVPIQLPADYPTPAGRTIIALRYEFGVIDGAIGANMAVQ